MYNKTNYFGSYFENLGIFFEDTEIYQYTVINIFIFLDEKGMLKKILSVNLYEADHQCLQKY
jgi:hypothetical protein